MKSSPLEAFILAIIVQITFNVTRKPIIGKPIIMKHSGTAITIYRRIDKWKFSAFRPFIFTQTDSSLFDIQQIRGPMTAPNGKKYPANADR